MSGIQCEMMQNSYVNVSRSQTLYQVSTWCQYPGFGYRRYNSYSHKLPDPIMRLPPSPKVTWRVGFRESHCIPELLINEFIIVSLSGSVVVVANSRTWKFKTSDAAYPGSLGCVGWNLPWVKVTALGKTAAAAAIPFAALLHRFSTVLHSTEL